MSVNFDCIISLFDYNDSNPTFLFTSLSRFDTTYHPALLMKLCVSSFQNNVKNAQTHPILQNPQQCSSLLPVYINVYVILHFPSSIFTPSFPLTHTVIGSPAFQAAAPADLNLRNILIYIELFLSLHLIPFPQPNNYFLTLVIVSIDFFCLLDSTLLYI